MLPNQSCPGSGEHYDQRPSRNLQQHHHLHRTERELKERRRNAHIPVHWETSQ